VSYFAKQMRARIEADRKEQTKLWSKRLPIRHCPLCGARAHVLHSAYWKCADAACVLSKQEVTEEDWRTFHLKMGSDAPRPLVVLGSSGDVLAYTRERGEHVADLKIMGAFKIAGPDGDYNYKEKIAQDRYGLSLGALVERQSEAIQSIMDQEDADMDRLMKSAIPDPPKGKGVRWDATDVPGILNEQKMRALGIPPQYMEQKDGGSLQYEPDAVIRAEKKETRQGWFLYQKQAKVITNGNAAVQQAKGRAKRSEGYVWPEDPWSARLELIPEPEPTPDNQLTFDWEE